MSKVERSDATEAASKDPDDVGITMLLQGVLPRWCAKPRMQLRENNLIGIAEDTLSGSFDALSPRLRGSCLLKMTFCLERRRRS